MLKNSLSFAVTFFTAKTLWQILSSQPISWFDNVMVSLLMFIGYLFFEWVSIPYDWNKKKHKDKAEESDI